MEWFKGLFICLVLLTSTSVDAKLIKLQWEHSPSEGVISYNIYVLNGDQKVLIDSVGYINVWEQTFPDGESLWFAVSAFNGEDESVLSNAVFSPPVLDLNIEWEILNE